MLDILIQDFFLRAIIAGLAVAALAGPLGCFIVWRRMAYFGDTMAHSGLLGVALGFVLGIDLTIGVIVTTVTLALLLAGLQGRATLANDTLLGILSHSALATGLVVASFLTWVRFDLMAYLFGDILAVSWADIGWIAAGVVVAAGLLAAMWRSLLAMTVHEDLAAAEGIPVARMRIGFMLLIAFAIAAAMKVVGILLITSLLIIPAAAARTFSETPERMAAVAAVIGGIAVVAGLVGSATIDTPSGPSIVVAAAVLFIATLAVGRRA